MSKSGYQQRWQEGETLRLKTLLHDHPEMTKKELAQKLGRSIDSIRGKINQLGLHKYKVTRQPYTQHTDLEIQRWRRLGLTRRQISLQLNRSYNSVCNRIDKLLRDRVLAPKA